METIQSLRGQLEALRATQRVAIIGTGLRAPGGIADREAYWQALAEGRDLTNELPEHRRRTFADDWDGLLSRGGYLKDVLDFDAKFFGISPREARSLDPQHRLLLEVVWEAFEDAAIPPASVAESTGVFVGITSQDYRLWADGEPSSSWLIGNGHCFAAGRIAYTLGFQGPTMAIDTACSSSLVALHTACRALAAGDCDVALAGGVSLVLAPRSTAEIQRTEALSPDGRCRPFDARANGFVRGEGCGAVVLKRLADAERDGDRILAVIEGTGVNQDGQSSGFTAPNVLAQTRLIESVLASAGLTAADIGYLEAHGTGTPLGDPIELEAARTALGSPRRTWHVGSVKANLGHAEAAAGVLGLIKAVLCLEKRRIPQQAQFETLNPRIELGDSGMTVPTETVPWDSSAGRCAAVSSFGMSGTNAHVVLSSSDSFERVMSPATASGFLVSAHTESALRALAIRYAVRLSEADYPAFVYTATHGRTRLRFAAWIKADSAQEARDALTALGNGTEDPRMRMLDSAEAVPSEAPARAVLSLPTYPWEKVTYSIRPLGVGDT
ncbi:beta-ketoacyl synthase N-terminal-like domain-containing protein [Streptomyces ureilyticus]|uniref:Polyketide synthase n=1 Tax=Streptomyces ureilyticus TaxID=1775131 RepID=A0ABX0DX05_9ACTN|nr:polyketide synthase [Streptomyces ureilyticus]NGO45825.1 polyketide synthase [Streptomyces ureilyticus]